MQQLADHAAISVVVRSWSRGFDAALNRPQLHANVTHPLNGCHSLHGQWVGWNTH